MNSEPTSRRLYITENSTDFFKLFNVKQGSTDADFYFSWPDAINSKFFILDTFNQKNELRTFSSESNGRLSFHASGQSHFAEEGKKTQPEYVVKGNQLYNSERNEIGVRHLFTSFLTDPSKRPLENSFAFQRATDDSFLTKNLTPAIILFFAVPNGCATKIEMKLNTDYFKVPDHLPGTGTFVMKHHSILWIAYQQIHLSWPKQNHIAYSDGNLIPLFIGKPNDKLDLIFTEPKYELSGSDLTIKIEQE